MEIIHASYRVLLLSCLVFLSLSAFACLFRAILGPRFTDRVISINVICTKVVIIITVFACLLGDYSLLDIAIVYAMISFLAVVVLSKCYLLPNQPNPADPEHHPVPDLRLQDKEVAE